MIHLARGEDGTLHLILPAALARRLEGLPDRLLEILHRRDSLDAVSQRLFPRFSADPQVDRELRGIAIGDLHRKKVDQVRAFAASLAACTPLLLRFRQVLLSPEQTASWIGFLNDMRLFLGTALNIQENEGAREFARRRVKTDSDEWLYLFLTELQGALIAADEPGT